MKIGLTELSIHPINEEIYSHTELDDLCLSLQTHGQLEPIVINENKTIISGHRRYFSMTQLGWDECEVRISKSDNEIVSLIEYNRTRIKSVSDILNESRYLEKELKREIGRGRNATAHRNGKRMSAVIEVSKKLGLSTTQLKKIKSISNYDPSLIEKIDREEISVAKAYEEVREKYIHRNKTDSHSSKDEFQKKFRKLLTEYEPDMSDINEALSKTYPYSLSDMENGEEKRDEFINHMDQLKKLDSREMTLYQKYQELKRMKPKPSLVKKVESQLWQPNDITNKTQTIREIESLEPVIEFVEKENLEEFNILRIKTSSMNWSVGPTRSVKFVVRNKPDGRYLGVITLASDMISVENRDNFIGWSETEKHKRLIHLACVSTCHATQPLGYNFLGGKLMASLATTSPIRDKWFERYEDRLIGLSTTSLYGQFSMYDRIPLWKSLGETKGHMFTKPDEEYFVFWGSWLKKRFPDEYEKATGRPPMIHSSPKQNLIRLIFRYLNISEKNYLTEHRRGLYFSNIYENGREFLCGEVTEDELVMNGKFEGDIEGILEWWRPKAIKRYEKLYDEDRVDKDTLFYDEIDPNIMKSWFLSRGVEASLIG